MATAGKEKQSNSVVVRSRCVHLGIQTTEPARFPLAYNHRQGDAVLALSKQSGRGWMMGVIVGRAGKGTYKVAFSDGSEEDDVRCVGRNDSG